MPNDFVRFTCCRHAPERLKFGKSRRRSRGQEDNAVFRSSTYWRMRTRRQPLVDRVLADIGSKLLGLDAKVR